MNLEESRRYLWCKNCGGELLWSSKDTVYDFTIEERKEEDGR